MQPSEHLHWTPTPHSTYFAHVSMGLEGNSLGMVLVRVETGRRPCRGGDSNPNDDYVGDVHCTPDGAPLAGHLIQYMPYPVIAGGPVMETRTDAQGRHRIWLAPGDYEYHSVNEIGNVSPRRQVTVTKGHEIDFELDLEDVVVSPEEEVDEKVEPVIVKRRREVSYVVMDLVLDWNFDDGMPFSWQAAEEVLINVCRRTPRLRQVSFARPTRPEVILTLQRRGIRALDVKWRDVEIGAAARNFNGLLSAKLLVPVGHTRCFYQIKNARKEGKRLVPTPGIPFYLAEAAFASAHFAAQASVAEAPLQRIPMLSGQQMLDNGSRPKDLQECLGEMFGENVPPGLRAPF